jgi:hypothetical protein
VALGVLAGGLALGSPVALAGEGLGITATFGTAGSGNGQFKEPDGVAVNQESKEVYVVDKGNNRVERFSAAGSYEGQFNGAENPSFPGGFSSPIGIAVDNACFYQKLSEPECKTKHSSNGDVYVISAGQGGVIAEFSATGSYISSLSVPGSISLEGVAVDSSGDLWVYYDETGTTLGEVDEFDEKGTLVDQFHTGRYTWSNAIGAPMAVDSAENAYVIFARQATPIPAGSSIGKFNHSGEQQAASETELVSATGLAVDLATNDLYVATTSLAQYGPFGEPFSAPLYRSGARSAMVNAGGVAVNSTSHDVYVVDSPKSRVDIFAKGPFPEAPVTLGAKVEASTVTVEGELKGGEEGYYFAYNDNGTCQGAGAGRTPEGETSGTVKESATISAALLEANTLYTFCMVAANAYGESFAPSLTFTTPPVPPVVEEAMTRYVGVFEATVEAKVHPENDTTTCVVEYGETTAYGAEATCEPASLSGHGGQLVSASPKGLAASTTYHYRVVAENAAGKSKPSEGTGEFTTAPALAAGLEAESVSLESGSGATREVTFEARVNPELQPTTSCAFQYVTEETFKKTGFTGTPPAVPCEESSQQIGDGSTYVPVKAKVADLQAGAAYHYRLVVKNETGTTEGKDQVFGPPTAVTGAVLSEAPGIAPSTTAPIGGEVDPEELPTRYYVQYGETGAYGQIAPFLPLGIKLPLGIDAGSGSVSVVLGSKPATPDVPLEALTAGETYHYRLVAYNADGTTPGADMTLTVPPAPLVGPATVSEVTQSSATITTSVDPEGLHTVYELEVGTSAAYGTPYPGDAGSGSAPVPLTFHLSGLKAGDTYHFRLTASNSDGSSSEGDQTFTTAATVVKVPVELIKLPFEVGLVSFTAIAFPTETKPTTPKALTNAQKLAKALKACKKKRPKSKRVACERKARKQYGPLKKKKK